MSFGKEISIKNFNFMNPPLHNETSKRFIAVLNKKIETGRAMNALGHMAAGLAGGSGHAEDMNFLQYEDKDGGAHPTISHYPFIVLKADNSNKMSHKERMYRTWYSFF